MQTHDLRSENAFLRAQIAELQRLVVTDALTGLWNRRHFDTQLVAHLQRAQRGRYPVALALVDVDYFKAVNDRFGHPVGDRVLREVAQCLRRQARSSDEVFRYGGEEFAVILAPIAPGFQVRQLGERLAAAVRRTPIPPVGVVTVSVGVAQYHLWDPTCAAGGPEAARLVQRADQALFAAKNKGRDRSCLM